MFAAQFCRGDTSGRPVRLDSRKTLIELAIEARLPPDEFSVALEADEYGRAVEVDRAQAAQLGITGVPALVIDGRYLVVGARPPEALARIIETIQQPGSKNH